MANVYAVKSGNWSDVTVWNTGALPTSADDVFANNFTVTIDQNFTVLSIRNTAAAPAVAGGSFSLLSGFTVNCTAATGVVVGPTTCVTYAGTGTSTLNAVIAAATTTNITSLVHSGTGVLNINGNLNNPGTSLGTRYFIVVNSSGTLNYTGSNGGMQVSYGILMSGTNSILNHVGNLSGANSGGALWVSGTAVTVNITGNLVQFTGGSLSSNPVFVNGLNCLINITGNIGIQSATATSIHNALNVSSVCTINIIGNVYGSASGFVGVNVTSNSYLKIIGTIFAGSSTYGVISSGSFAINIFTGPFVSFSSGIMPFSVSRMHYFRTMGSYFEFRDNSTGGALAPAAAAPATRLVSPDTVVDAPSPNNVRLGVVYASGSQTGTMRIPPASSVKINVPVDNTVGTGVVSADQIWDVLMSGMNTVGSIGERLKNVSTVATTGQQISSYNS